LSFNLSLYQNLQKKKEAAQFELRAQTRRLCNSLHRIVTA
jgi:hypothetical protein